MPSENKSPSYLAEREVVRRWLINHPDGQIARDLLRANAPGGNAAPLLDDDKWVDWEDIVEEYKGGTVFSANCAEARKAVELARQSSSIMAAPGKSKAHWKKFFSAPTGYVLRKQTILADPDYWNDPVNLYREALAHPEWCSVPASIIRGLLEQALPKPKREPVLASTVTEAGPLLDKTQPNVTWAPQTEGKG